MARQRFVNNLVRRYDLSDGDWVDFKEQLSYGDSQSLQSTSFKPVRKSGDNDTETTEVGIDFAKYNLYRLFYWISDWSLIGPNGKQVSPSLQSVRQLDEDSADELSRLLDEHLNIMKKEKNQDPENPTTLTVMPIRTE